MQTPISKPFRTTMTIYCHKSVTIKISVEIGIRQFQKLTNVKSGSALKPVQTCVVYLWNSSRAKKIISVIQPYTESALLCCCLSTQCMMRIMLAFNLDKYHLQENIIPDYIISWIDANKDYNKNLDYELIEFEEHCSLSILKSCDQLLSMCLTGGYKQR